MKYTGPKLKLCRREGVNLFGTEKYDLSNNHRKLLGGGKFGKMSEFGLQLRKKQAAKRMYGLTEKQFSKYYTAATKMSGVLGDNMLQLLELRLDNVIFKSNFARTPMQGRQFVNHAHFDVNGKKVNIPSYAIKVGDEISLREKMKDSPLYKTLLEEFKVFIDKNSQGTLAGAKWLEVNPSKLTIKVTRLPENSDFDQSIDIQKIIAFYSK